MKNLIRALLLGCLAVCVGAYLFDMDTVAVASLAFAVPTVGKSPLLWDGSENMGGFKNRVAFIPAADVSVVPALPLPADIAADADLVTAKGAFTFRTSGQKPKYIYATDKTIGFKSESQGEIDGQSFKQSGDFFFPGNKVAAAAFARYVNNTPGYLILEDPAGVQILVGQEGLPVRIKPSLDLGKAPSDRRGFTFAFEADSIAPMVVMGTPIDFEALLTPSA
ncbi:MAG: hypothetical protein ACRC5A_12805 [Enterobacteriaceae bacterium]